MDFPKNFFQAEIRSDFLVKELMKRAWAAEIEVLQIVINICKKHHITYFAADGTLLGAVRHQGFIPWDDDIDIALMRQEFNKLVRILSNELPDGFTIAGMHGKTERLQRITPTNQLRVIADDEYWNFASYLERFHGFPFSRIGIDIFCLDYIPKDKNSANLQSSLICILMAVATNLNYYQKNGQLEEKLTFIEEACNVTLKRGENLDLQLWHLIDALSCLYKENECDDVTNFIFFVNDPTYRMRKEWYQETIYLPFENIKIAAPKKYHEILTATYGDYIIPVKNTSLHTYPFYKKREHELESFLKRQGITVSITEFCQNWKKYLKDNSLELK